MTNKQKIILGACLGIGAIAITTLLTIKHLKRKNICLEGNDDDIVYLLLEDDK